jgi:hypothetical protein
MAESILSEHETEDFRLVLDIQIYTIVTSILEEVVMKKEFRIALITIAALLITAGTSWASTVVYDNVGFFKTETFFTEEFTISNAGSYTSTLTDFNFPAPMVDIGMDVTTATDLLGSLLTPGSFNFNATPGKYFVSFFGIADTSTSSQLGQFGIEISQVPVPAAAWLFVSGLMGLIVIARHKNP